MTIAQRKIRQYGIDNNISLRRLSLKLGYSDTYLFYLVHGRIPSEPERQTIEDFFGIKNNSHLLRSNIIDKHRFISVAHKYYNLFSGYTVYWRTFYRWANGIYSRDIDKLRPLFETYNIKNEWTELDNRNVKEYNPL